MSGGYHAAEQTLFEAGKWHEVRQARMSWQDTMQVRFIDTIERLTHRTVKAFMSANHRSPDVTVVLFVLARNDVADPAAPTRLPFSELAKPPRVYRPHRSTSRSPVSRRAGVSDRARRCEPLRAVPPPGSRPRPPGLLALTREPDASRDKLIAVLRRLGDDFGVLLREEPSLQDLRESRDG